MTATVHTIAKGDSSRLVEPRRFLVRDRAAFNAVWVAHSGPDSESTIPPVDFDTHMVAAVFAGERPTPGYEISIDGVRQDGDTLFITVVERAPDPGMMAAQMIVSPFHIVTVPRHDGDVAFDDEGKQAATIVFKPPRSQSAVHRQASGASKTRRKGSTREIAPGELDAGSPSSTGLSPEMAATMAYLAGPLSGALLLATERTSRFVRFHAWQAVFALGILATAAATFLALAFAMLIVSPTAFWAMLWLAAATGVAWFVVWALCLLHAYKGQTWKLPLAGDYAERFA